MVVNGDFETHGFFASLKTACDRFIVETRFVSLSLAESISVD